MPYVTTEEGPISRFQKCQIKRKKIIQNIKMLAVQDPKKIIPIPK